MRMDPYCFFCKTNSTDCTFPMAAIIIRFSSEELSPEGSRLQKQKSKFQAQHHMFWGACSLSSCNTCSARKRWVKKKKKKTALVGACKRWHSHYTDTGWRWHHYLECLHLLAWGCDHWRLCLQLHSRNCALSLQVRQDIWVSVIREKTDRIWDSGDFWIPDSHCRGFQFWQKATF